MPFLPIIQQDVDQILKAERLDLFKLLKVALDLAVHVSPLVLLTKLPMSTNELSRPVLVKVCLPIISPPF